VFDALPFLFYSVGDAFYFILFYSLQSKAQRKLALRAILAPFSPSRFFSASEHSGHLRQSQTAQEEKGKFVSSRSNSVTCRACSPGRFSSLVVDKDGDTAECRSMAAISVAS
jgi:hypothetical protein